MSKRRGPLKPRIVSSDAGRQTSRDPSEAVKESQVVGETVCATLRRVVRRFRLHSLSAVGALLVVGSYFVASFELRRQG